MWKLESVKAIFSNIQSDRGKEGERSEEVQDIVDRMPTGWAWMVTAIVTIIILTMLILSCFIEYSDTVSGRLSITCIKSPVRISTIVTGRLHLLADNAHSVEKGNWVGYIETGAEIEDLRKLDRLCETKIDLSTRLELPENLKLGALSAAYNDFAQSYKKLQRLRDTKLYLNMLHALEEQQKHARQANAHLQKEIEYSQKVASNIQDRYAGDSILFKAGALCYDDLRNAENSMLSQGKQHLELENSALAKQLEINSVEIEKAKIHLQYHEELMNAYHESVAKHNVLIGNFQEWKSNYLFVAPIGGVLEYVGFWRNNVYVNANEQLFTISPKENTMIGEMEIASVGAGKVEQGQKVVIKLDGYPYEEYGYLEGRVSAIATLPKTIRVAEGAAEGYRVEVALSKIDETNFGKAVLLNFETKGTGDIITKPRKLIQRLFDNLKATRNR